MKWNKIARANNRLKVESNLLIFRFWLDVGFYLILEFFGRECNLFLNVETQKMLPFLWVFANFFKHSKNKLQILYINFLIE